MTPEAFERHLRDLEASRCLLGRRADHRGRRGAVRGRVRLRESGLGHPEHPRDAVRHGIDHQAVHGGGRAPAGRAGGASGWRRARSRYLGLEGTVISPDVTVRHLLTHTSGIGDDADEEAGESYEEVWRDRPNYSVREAVDFLPQFVHRAPNFAPGQGCRYNNCGYVLLGLMVERATGRPVPRRRAGGRLRAGRDGRLGLPEHGPRQRAAGRRCRSDPRRGGRHHRLEAEHLLVPAHRLARRRGARDRRGPGPLHARRAGGAPAVGRADRRLPRAPGRPQRARRLGGALRLRAVVPRQ